jgi:TIR domain
LLRGWVSEDRQDLRVERAILQAAQEWESFGRDTGTLLKGARLAQAEEWSARHALELAEYASEFLRTSIASRDEEVQKEKARQQEQIDNAKRLRAEAEARALYSCFISYSTKDQEFAERLHGDLEANGVRCWFAPHDVRGGRKLNEQIDEAIRQHDKLLLILSRHSMSSSWVKTEVAKARDREEREKKQLLFPITLASFEDVKKWELFDADRGIDSAKEIREYFIPDFSNWMDHESYQTAFQRLVENLKAEANK